MDLPEILNLQLKCEAATLEDLIVVMTICAGNKNPYHILFPKSDRTGRTQLMASDVRGQFYDEAASGLMDYNGSIESASQYVRLKLFDPEPMRKNLKTALAWPLFENEKKWWNSRRQKVDYLLTCRNDLFELARPPIRFIEIKLDEALILELRLKAQAQSG